LKAVHILSHNAVLMRDKKGRRYIATGKGIGFMKKKGDRINQELIRNIFIEDHNFENRKAVNN